MSLPGSATRLYREIRIHHELRQARKQLMRVASHTFDEETYNRSPEEYDAYMQPFRPAIHEAEDRVRELQEELKRLREEKD